MVSVFVSQKVIPVHISLGLSRTNSELREIKFGTKKFHRMHNTNYPHTASNMQYHSTNPIPANIASNHSIKYLKIHSEFIQIFIKLDQDNALKTSNK